MVNADMATSPRRDNAKPGSGRPERRTRVGSRPGVGLTPNAAAGKTGGEAVNPTSKRVAITGRAIALVCVLMLVVLFYAPTLRIYLDEKHQIAVLEQEIRDKNSEISKLEGELARWDDPNYVRTQARSRLGWVLPGETGFRVVDENGNVLAGGAEIGDGSEDESQLVGGSWIARMWGSLETADKPTVKIKR
ncbi:MAG: septum formation initiator family protein [Propionibacteriaceae bacterium]|jgi:cell division protein FtsB|nr:septum formation initiator family protein [Propionibacteriaceae bacterium]